MRISDPITLLPFVAKPSGAQRARNSPIRGASPPFQRHKDTLP